MSHFQLKKNQTLWQCTKPLKTQREDISQRFEQLAVVQEFLVTYIGGNASFAGARGHTIASPTLRIESIHIE